MNKLIKSPEFSDQTKQVEVRKLVAIAMMEIEDAGEGTLIS